MKQAKPIFALASVAALAASASAGPSSFVLQRVEGVEPTARAALMADGVAQAETARVYVLYLTFAPTGEGEFPGLANEKLLAMEDVSIELVQPQFRFFQSEAPGAGDTPPLSADWASDPSLQWDSFVSLGVSNSNVFDSTTTAPDFVFDEHHIAGSWFDAEPESALGTPPVTNPSWLLIARFTVLGACDEDLVYFEGVGTPVGTADPVGSQNFSLVPGNPAAAADNTQGPIGVIDLQNVLMRWGSVNTEGCWPAADFNADGVVNGLDLVVVLSNWGEIPKI